MKKRNIKLRIIAKTLIASEKAKNSTLIKAAESELLEFIKKRNDLKREELREETYAELKNGGIEDILGFRGTFDGLFDTATNYKR